MTTVNLTPYKDRIKALEGEASELVVRLAEANGRALSAEAKLKAVEGERDEAVKRLGQLGHDTAAAIFALRAQVDALVEGLEAASKALKSGQPQVVGDDTVYPLDGALVGNALNACRKALSSIQQGRAEP